MLRLIHTQTVQGALLVDDIDDGLPNKNNPKLGDPKAYKKDGYANRPKQKCYVPRVKPTDATIAGYIDLNETDTVKLSAVQGKIAGFQRAGNITVVSFVASDLTAPAVSNAVVDSPGAGDITITGTNFLSVAPNISKVRLFGAGVGDITLTRTQILAGAGGAFTATSIVIDTLLAPSLAVGDSVIVTADDLASNTFVAV